MARTAGIKPITIALKVDMDGANKQAIAAANETTQAVVGAYSRIGALQMGAIGGVIGALGGVATAMLFGVGAASRFEDSFAGIRKTVEASQAQFEDLQLSVRNLAQEIPIATSELNNIGELGGQLGIEAGGLPIFIETISKLGVATRLSTETAALSLARMKEIFQLPEANISNLASSLVDLGNNFAALEDEILSTALRLAAGAKVAGATAADTLAIATALQAVGVQSQAGGTAMARIFQALTLAVQSGGKELQAFLRVTQLTREQFISIAQEDPAQALNLFLQGISRISKEGGNYITILEDLNLKQQRTIRAVLATAEAGDLLTETLATANSAYSINNALNEEAEKRFETLKSQTKLMKNTFQELRIEVGMALLPVMKEMTNALTAMFSAMGESEDQIGKMSTLGKTIIGVFTVLGFAMTAIAGQFFSVRAQAAAAELSLRQYSTAVLQVNASHELMALGASRATKAYFAMTTMIKKALGPISILLIAASAVSLQNAAANRKAEKAAGIYSETLSKMGPLLIEAAEKQERYNELAGNVPTAVLETLRYELELINESVKELNITNLQAFMNIPKGIDDIDSEKAARLGKSFTDIANGVRDITDEMRVFDELADVSEAEGRKSPFTGLLGEHEVLRAIARELSVSTEDLKDVLSAEDGVTGLFSMINAQLLSGNEDAATEVSSILDQYFTDVNAALLDGQAAMDLRGMVPSTNLKLQTQIMQDNLNDGFEIVERLNRLTNESEYLEEAAREQLAAYNAIARETAGLNQISFTKYITDAEAAAQVQKVLSGNVEEAIDQQAAFNEKINDMLGVIAEAASETQDLKYLFEELAEIPLFDEKQIQENLKRAEQLRTFLFLGVSELIGRGFGGLAGEIFDVGLEVENLGKLYSILSNQIPLDQIERLNENAINSNEEYAALAGATEEFTITFLQNVQQQLGIQKDIVDEKEREAAFSAVIQRIEEDRFKKQNDLLGVVREIVDMARSEFDTKEDIKELTEDIAGIEKTRTYDAITITQAQADSVELKEAELAVEEAIREFGAEGVVTQKEQLSILQAALNLQRMRDKLENKMSKRQQKNIRDKQKEVKFLQLAVEQGVAEQLDLDAAQEELDNMRNPLTQAEKDILDLQIKLAESEKKVLEERSKLISPQIISAIDGYNKATNISNERAKTLTEKQRELERALEDQNFDLLENETRIQELKEEYPNLVDLLNAMTPLIGVPAGLLESYVNSMDASYTKFQTIANNIANTNLPGYDPNLFGNLDQTLPSQTRGPKYDPSKGLIINGVQVIPPVYTPPLPGGYDPQTGMANGIRIHAPMMNNYTGGNVPMGRASVVGEMGPEVIMSTPGGTSVFSNKTGSGVGGITVENMNVNITGLPADPISARKAAINIRKELTKLEKEGNAGTGLRNR